LSPRKLCPSIVEDSYYWSQLCAETAAFHIRNESLSFTTTDNQLNDVAASKNSRQRDWRQFDFARYRLLMQSINANRHWIGDA